MSLFVPDSIVPQVEACLLGLKEEEAVFTIIRRLKTFSAYDSATFSAQVSQWRTNKCRLDDDNVFERTIKGKKVWLFIIQPNKMTDDIGMCPLAASLDVLVDGYGYITTQYEIVEQVKAALAREPVVGPRKAAMAGGRRR